MSQDGRIVQIGDEAEQGIALSLRRLGFAHNRCAGHHPQSIEDYFGAVSVGICHQARLQHSIVIQACARLPTRPWFQSTTGHKRHNRLWPLAEGVAEPSGEKEVLSRVRQFHLGRVSKGPPRK